MEKLNRTKNHLTAGGITSSAGFAGLAVPETLRVALIDDDAIFSVTMRHFAKAYGVILETFESFNDLAVLGVGHFGMYVLDRDLGEQDGIDIARYLWQRGDHSPVLIISASSKLLVPDQDWPVAACATANKEAGCEGVFREIMSLHQRTTDRKQRRITANT